MRNRVLKTSLVIGGFCLAWMQSIAVFAQAVSLPAGWQQMGPVDFASAVRVVYEKDEWGALTIDDQVAAKNIGKSMFLQVDLASTALNYQTLEMLFWVARGDLDDAVRNRTASALIARQDSWTKDSYAEVKAKIMMMVALKVPTATIVSEGQRWVRAGGTIDQVPAEDLNYDIARMVFADVQLIKGSFSVVWEGQVTPPQAGVYQFLLSPIDVSQGFNRRPVHMSTTITLSGQDILTWPPAADSDDPTRWLDPSSWGYQSSVISLAAGQAVPIRVTTTVKSARALPEGALHVNLTWKTPDGTTTVVPAANLSLADGSGPGLKATYTWDADVPNTKLVRTEPNIDVAWMKSPILLSKSVDIASQNADTLWNTLTSSDYLNSLTASTPVRFHPFLREAEDSSAGLTTERRAKFLDILLQYPKLLTPMDAKFAVRFFEPFRYGAADKALDVFGTWSTMNADMACDFSDDRAFNGDQRLATATMAIFVSQQYPDQASVLQNKYLQLTDGRCSLPVAYTMACSYLGRKKYGDWINLLDTKLADPSVKGDLRVNWLIARANAAELVEGSSSHYPSYFWAPFHIPLKGRKYLDEAVAAAQTPSVKVRAAREIAARLIWNFDYAGAKAALQALGTSLPSDQQAFVAKLQQQIDGFSTANQQAQLNQLTLAKQQHLAELQRRRDVAEKAGDAAGVSRYESLISALSGQN